MSQEKDRGAEIIEAHQELVGRIEGSVARIRVLSAVTVAVAVVLAASYLLQLLLPFYGVDSVRVNLTDPGNVAAEVVVLALVLVWLYVGLSDLRFSSRMRREIRAARAREKEIAGKLPEMAPGSQA